MGKAEGGRGRRREGREKKSGGIEGERRREGSRENGGKFGNSIKVLHRKYVVVTDLVDDGPVHEFHGGAGLPRDGPRHAVRVDVPAGHGPGGWGWDLIKVISYLSPWGWEWDLMCCVGR